MQTNTHTYTHTGVTFLSSKVDGVSHADGLSTVRLTDGRSIQGSMVLDATGHARKLVNFDQKFDPGYQGAYGITAGGNVCLCRCVCMCVRVCGVCVMYHCRRVYMQVCYVPYLCGSIPVPKFHKY
jgi:hypothetical protein